MANIEWENPITNGLAYALDVVSGSDLVTGIPLTYVSAPPKRVGAKGVSFAGNNTSFGYIVIPQTLPETLTLVCIANNVTRTGNTNVLCGLGVSSGNGLLCFQASTVANNKFIIRKTSGGGTSERHYSANAASSVTPAVMIATAVDNNGTSANVYWNGILDNGAVLDASTGLSTNFDRFAVGGVRRSVDAIADTGNDILLALLFTRVLSAGEIASLSINPWQIIKALPIYWVPPTVSIVWPKADVLAAGWTGVPNNTSKVANINEAAASDSEYVISPGLAAAPDPFVFDLSGTWAAGTLDVHIREQAVPFYTGQTVQLRVLLLDAGGKTVGTGAWRTLTGSYATYTDTITTTGTATQGRLEVQAI